MVKAKTNTSTASWVGQKANRNIHMHYLESAGHDSSAPPTDWPLEESPSLAAAGGSSPLGRWKCLKSRIACPTRAHSNTK